MNASVVRGLRLTALTRSPWAHEVAQTIGGRFLVVLFGLVSTVILARTLGPSGRGTYAAALTAATVIVIVGTFGLQAANTFTLGARPATLPALAGNSVVVALAVGIAGVALFQVVRVVSPDLLPVRGGLAVLALMWVPLNLVLALLQPLLLVLNRVRAHLLLESGWQVFAVGTIVVLWAVHRLTPTTAMAAGLVALAGAVIGLLGMLRAATDRALKPSLSLFRSTLGYSTRSYMLSIASYLLLRVDILIVNQMLTPRDVGLYTVAATAGEIIMIGPATVGSLLFARLAQRTEPSVWPWTRRVLMITGVALVAACTAVLHTGRPLIAILYGGEFAAAFPAVRALLPGLVFGGLNLILTNYFLSREAPRPIVLLQGSALAANVFLNLWLIPRHGIVGASLASSIAYGGLFIGQFVAAVVESRHRADAALAGETTVLS